MLPMPPRPRRRSTSNLSIRGMDGTTMTPGSDERSYRQRRCGRVKPNGTYKRRAAISSATLRKHSSNRYRCAKKGFHMALSLPAIALIIVSIPMNASAAQQSSRGGAGAASVPAFEAEPLESNDSRQNYFFILRGFLGDRAPSGASLEQLQQYMKNSTLVAERFRELHDAFGNQGVREKDGRLVIDGVLAYRAMLREYGSGTSLIASVETVEAGYKIVMARLGQTLQPARPNDTVSALAALRELDQIALLKSVAESRLASVGLSRLEKLALRALFVDPSIDRNGRQMPPP